MSEFDVLIGGYGPTGAVAANLLGAMGHKVLVIEPSLHIYDIPRAVHFDGEVMRIFQALGLADQIASVSSEGRRIAFTNARNWQLFEQDLSLVPRQHGWYNNLFFNQPKLEHELRLGVARYANVEIRLGWAVGQVSQGDGQVEVEIVSVAAESDPQVREVAQVGYLLACDGASSPIRKQLDIAQEDLQCDEPWLVCDLFLDDGTEVNRHAVQICDPVRPTTLVPCEGTHIRWEFMLNADDKVNVLEDEALVRQMMAPHLWRLSPTLTAQDGELVRAKVYQFHALIAESFQHERTFLLGDAAHQTPPFLGQGMCAGVRDAYNLCWKLDRVLRGQSDPKLLESYSSERRPHVREVIKTAVAIGEIIQTRNRMKAWFRDCFLKLGRVFPVLVSALKFGEGWSLGPGLLDDVARSNAQGIVGQPIPQGREDGGWSDELLTDGFTIVGFGVDPRDLLTNIPVEHGLQMLKVDGELRTWASEHQIVLALVRPDRQVYGLCSVGDDVGQRLQSLLVDLQQGLV